MDDGSFYLFVRHTDQGGTYTCSLRLAPEASRCVDTTTTLIPATFFVVTPDTRLEHHGSVLDGVEGRLKGVEEDVEHLEHR
jgi:hypothetical protein